MLLKPIGMPTKYCLVKSCKDPGRIFRFDLVEPNVREAWLAVIDTENRKNLGRPYGVCVKHFSGMVTYSVTPIMEVLNTF